MPRRIRPYVELLLDFALAFDFELDGGWYTVKMATPAVTARMITYFERGYRRWKRVMWRNITGRSLHDFARTKVR